jgi:lysozyme
MTLDDLRTLKADLYGAEDLRLKAYDDKTGKTFLPGHTLEGQLTIGVGRNLTARGISRVEADYLLDNDIADAIGALSFAFPWFNALDSVRQRALVELHVNMGLDGLRGFHKMLAAIQKGDWATAASELLDSAWVTQVSAQRSSRLARMLRDGPAQYA